MKVCAFAAEYNPFHEGHRYHIEEARRKSGCDVMMAVMSGNFVQRGEPAVCDRTRRAEAAVRNGADIVISLPYLFSTQSATVFAHGAVETMKLAGATHIAFGSECANLDNLLEIAETPVNPDHLHENLDAGMAFPKAYSLLTTSMKPNDILAVCYLKEIAGTVSIPCLRKDFVVDEYMIYETKMLGASAVLLICSILSEDEIGKYISICDELGLSALVEAHDETEVATALRAGARMIGVNNRNLKDFSVNMDNCRRLRDLIPREVIFVAESGVKDASDVARLREIGADAVLIGETLMRAPDKAKKLAQLKSLLK